MDRLELNLSAVDDVHRALSTLCDEFTHAQEIADGVADAVGHHDLRSALEDFADNWKQHRATLTQDVTSLVDLTNGILTTMQTVDQGLRLPGKQPAP